MGGVTVEVRTNRAGGGGAVIARDKFGTSIAGMAVADYRLDGTSVLLVVSAVGEVRGYLPLSVKVPAPTTTAEAKHPNRKRTSSWGVGGADGGAGLASLVAKMRDLERRKRDILAELGGAGAYSFPLLSRCAYRSPASEDNMLCVICVLRER